MIVPNVPPIVEMAENLLCSSWQAQLNMAGDSLKYFCMYLKIFMHTGQALDLYRETKLPELSQ